MSHWDVLKSGQAAELYCVCSVSRGHPGPVIYMARLLMQFLSSGFHGSCLGLRHNRISTVPFGWLIQPLTNKLGALWPVRSAPCGCCPISTPPPKKGSFELLYR